MNLSYTNVVLKDQAPSKNKTFTLRVGVFSEIGFWYNHDCGVEQLKKTGFVSRTSGCPWPGVHLELMQLLARYLPHWNICYTIFDTPHHAVTLGVLYENLTIEANSQFSMLNATIFDVLAEEIYLQEDRKTIFQFASVTFDMGRYAALTTESKNQMYYRTSNSSNTVVNVISSISYNDFSRLIMFDIETWLCLLGVALLVHIVTKIHNGSKIWSLVRGLFPNQYFDWISADLRCCYAPLSLLCAFLFAIYANMLLVNLLIPEGRTPFYDLRTMYQLIDDGKMELIAEGTHFEQIMFDKYGDVLKKHPPMYITEAVTQGDLWQKISAGEAAYVSTRQFPVERLEEFNRAMTEIKYVYWPLFEHYLRMHPHPFCTSKIPCKSESHRLNVVNVLPMFMLFFGGVFLGAASWLVEMFRWLCRKIRQ